MKAAIACLIALTALSGCKVFKGKEKTPTVGERLSVMSLQIKTEADPLLADTEVLIPEAQANSDWGQPGAIPSKAPGNLVLAAAPTRVWDARITGSNSSRRLSAGPVVSDGRLFVIDTDGRVNAFTAATGGKLWTREIVLKGQSDNNAFGGGASAGNGRVYAATGFGVVAAFEAASGTPVWRMELGLPLRGAPAVTEDTIYVLSQDNQMFALDAATGARKWDVAGTIEQAGLLGAATPAVAQGTVVAGYSSGELVAYLTGNGRTVWQDALARTGRSTAIASLGDIDASPVIDRDRVFAIGHGGRMVALELNTGQRVWERNFAGVSIPWLAGDYLYASTISGEIVAVTRADGRVRWVTQLPNFTNMKKKKGDEIRWYGPVMASGKLWITGSHGRVGWVDPQTGKLGPSQPVSGKIYLSPVVAGGMMFVLTDEGRLIAYR